MEEQKINFRQVWIKRDLWEKVEKLRIRDETNSSLIQFLYDFYMDNRPDREEIIYIENKKELKI